MRIDDVLYFAPNIRFDEMDYGSPALPMQFASRLRGFYLDPAARALHQDDAFAAGVLLVCCIDAMARFDIGGNVGDRFKSFAGSRLPSFSAAADADILYSEFRNGLVHESRIKRGAQFSLDLDPDLTFQQSQGVSVINPRRLLVEVNQALDVFVQELLSDPLRREKFAQLLQADHANDD